MAIYKYLENVRLFTRSALCYNLSFNILQISSKVASPHKKNPCNSFAVKCFNFVFSDINTDARFGFYPKNESIVIVI